MTDSPRDLSKVTSPRDSVAGPSALPAPSRLSNLTGLALALCLWVGAYVVLGVATAAMTEDAFGRLGGTSFLLLPLLAAVTLALTTLWLLMRGVMCDWTMAGVVAGAVGTALLSQGIHALMDPTPGRDWATVALFGLANVGLIGTAMFIGKFIGSRVERLSWVIPIALVVAAVDVWSAYLGPTRTVAQQVVTDPTHAETGQRFMLWYPNLTPVAENELAVTPAFGFGDLLVAAMLFEIARRFALSLGLSIVALFAALIGAVLLAAKTQWGVPALPLLGALFVGVHWARIPKDRREIAICLIFLASLFAVLLLVINPTVAALWPHETP